MIAASNAPAVLILLLGLAGVPVANGFSAIPKPKTVQPPMPFKWPVVGTLPDFMARGGADRLRQIYEEMYTEFGPVYGMSIMGEDELILCDPNAFDTVLRKEGKYPIGGAELVTTFTEYYKETNNTMGMQSTSHGPEWKEWRTSMNRDMYVDWAGYLPQIADTASKISNVAGYEVTEQNNISFEDFISRSAFDMFTSVMYGESPQTTDSKVATQSDIDFVTASQVAFDMTGKVILNPLEKTFGSDIYNTFKVNMDKTFDMGYDKAEVFFDKIDAEQKGQTKMVEKEAAVGSEGEVSSSSKCPVTTIKNNLPFFERIKNRGQISTEDIKSFSGPLLMAGGDTTTYVMSWLFLNLASNPTVQTRLAQELKEVLNGADVTTVEQMEALPYLKACIRESHRLTPTTATSIKKIQEDIDVVIRDETYHVSAGQKVSLNLRAYPMDPRFVDNPTEYQPERFLPEAVEARKGTPSEVIDHPSFADPFGRGKRRCLGANIAVAEITVLAARLIQDYDLSLVDANDADEWEPKQKLMLKADPYPAMTLIPRGRKSMPKDILPML